MKKLSATLCSHRSAIIDDAMVNDVHPQRRKQLLNGVIFCASAPNFCLIICPNKFHKKGKVLKK